MATPVPLRKEPVDSLIVLKNLTFYDNNCIKSYPCNKVDCILHPTLDSTQRVNWSHKILGFESLYNAWLISNQNPIGKNQVKILYISADDFSRSFLITSNKDDRMINFVQLSDEFGDGTSDQDGFPVEYHDYQNALFSK